MRVSATTIIVGLCWRMSPQVQSQEAVAQEKAAATKAIADDAQRDLDEALPALDVAVACLKDLKKSDIDEASFSRSQKQSIVGKSRRWCV